MEAFKYFFSYDTDIPAGLGVQNFTPTHFTWLAMVFVLMVIGALAYRRLETDGRRRVMKTMAITILLLEVARNIWAIAIGHYNLQKMLPLHLCGIMIFVYLLAVFTDKRIFKELAYCTGLPGALMALLTPEQPNGYPFLNFQYLQSIVIHSLIVMVPFLMVFADGFRPNIKYLPQCFLWLCALTLFDAGVNWLVGSNYMFICKAPPQTPIELYDKWVGHPWYVGLLLLTLAFVWTLMILPWEIGRARRGGRETSLGA